MIDPITTLHVTCFKWGDLYTAGDVNRLHAMFARHLRLPHTLHCLTDDASGLHPDIVVHPLPDLSFCDWDIGNARKLVVFARDFLGLEGQHLLQVDVDMVLIGDVGFLIDRPEKDFLIARGKRQSGNTRGHSAILRLKIGSMTAVWDDFVRDPGAAVQTCQHHRGLPGHVSDQRWLDRCIAEMYFFEDDRIVYFRQDCGAHADVELPEGHAIPPDGARIISFAGRIKPQHVMHGPSGQWRHAPFVAQHWRE